jgi:hypothetical protein
MEENERFYDCLFISDNEELWLGESGGNLQHESRFYSFSFKLGWSEYHSDNNLFDEVSFCEAKDSTILISGSGGVGLVYMIDAGLNRLYGRSIDDDPSLIQFDQEGISGARKLQKTGMYPSFSKAILNDSTILSYTYRGYSYFKFLDKEFEFLSYHPLPISKHIQDSLRRISVNPSIYLFDENDIWISYGDALFLCQDDTISRIIELGMDSDEIIEIDMDKDGKVWLITLTSLWVYDSNVLRKIDVPSKYLSCEFSCLEIDENKGLWIGTKKCGLLHQNLK